MQGGTAGGELVEGVAEEVAGGVREGGVARGVAVEAGLEE
jgi:hypothetical protein